MIISIIAIIIVLSVVILIHEFGHFWAAKRTGTKVEEFGIGYPPRIFGLKRGGTTYSINWIPFGGFVKIKGEAGENSENDKKNSFLDKTIGQRALIMSFGIILNIFLSIVLISISFMIGAPSDVGGAGNEGIASNIKVQIMTVEKDSPADKADLKTGDAILSINGNRITKIQEINDYNKDRFNELINLEIKRNNQIISKSLVLSETVEDNGTKKAIMGVGLVEMGIVRYPFFKAIWLGIKFTFSFIALMFVFIFDLLKDLVIGKPAAGGLTGPIGVAVMTGQAVKLGFSYILQFTAIISINLAVFNIIPFPGLDGSKLLFLVIEKIRRKRISLKIENMIHSFGFYILIILSIFIAFKDWQRYF